MPWKHASALPNGRFLQWTLFTLMLPLHSCALLYRILYNIEKIYLWMQTSSNHCLFKIMLSVTTWLNYLWRTAGSGKSHWECSEERCWGCSKNKQGDGKVEKTAEWLVDNQFCCSLTAVHKRDSGRKAWVMPTTWNNCGGWPWLGATLPPKHSLTLFNREVEENRTRMLMGQDKDRDNICQLVLWVKIIYW